MIKKFWLLVFNMLTGDFSKAWGKGRTGEWAAERFKQKHPKFQVIRFGRGIHPKTYRGLQLETK